MLMTQNEFGVAERYGQGDSHYHAWEDASEWLGQTRRGMRTSPVRWSVTADKWSYGGSKAQRAVVEDRGAARNELVCVELEWKARTVESLVRISTGTLSSS